MDGRLPVVVGREAIELYTRRNYTTGDIDLTAPKALLEEVLKSWNFIKKGRVRFNKTLDIYIDWLAEDLDEGKEAEERVNTILIGENIEIRGISIED
ncbi:hypothetical protein BMS3Bbin05_02124 [bacterium BMS3Bbin05]|nr:hypothetical protein BMS3Bbin05_02124 [bacterium BMS3Bbin05]